MTDKLQNLIYRKAKKTDLEAIIAMLADDQLGAQRENFNLPLPEAYITAFDQIIQDPNQELMVIEENKEIIGTFQITYIQYLNYQGSTRALIESVRIKSTHRGRGIGNAAFEYIINRTKEKGCIMLQLTSDKQRPDAIRFYESLGFKASHEGFKLHFR